MEKENKKNNKLLIAILIIIIVILGVLCILFATGVISYMTVNSETTEEKEITDNTEAKENNENIKDNTANSNFVEITNEEIKTLYDYVKPTKEEEIMLKENSKTVFNNLLTRIASNNTTKSKNLTIDMVKNLSNEEILSICGTTNPNDCINIKYLDMDTIYNDINIYFNLTKSDLNLSENINGLCMGYNYIKVLDKMVMFEQCGGGTTLYTETIYDYKETNNEIYLYVAYASGDTTSYELLNGDKVSGESFTITNDNLNNLHHIKYTFKKNEQDKYYISNIEKEQ